MLYSYRANLQYFSSKWPLKSLGLIRPRTVRDRVKSKIGLTLSYV
jgi:hypothetical protein